MEVILQEDIPSLGKAGEVVAVKAGYARNYLIPRKKAVVASLKNVAMLDHQKRVVAQRKSKVKKDMEELAKKLAELSITVAKEAGEEGKLFGSVTAMEIGKALRNEGVQIDKHQIHIKEPIKQIGVFEVDVKLHTEVTGTLKVWVVKK